MANLKMSEDHRRQTQIPKSPGLCQFTEPPLTPSPKLQKMSVHFWAGLVSAKCLWNKHEDTAGEKK